MFYYVLYDKNLNALGNRKTYPVEKWSYKKCSSELSALKIDGMALESDIESVFVSLNDELGKILVLALSGIPEIKSGKASVIASDLRSLFNIETLLDFTLLTITNNKISVVAVFNVLKDAFNKIDNIGTIHFNYSEIMDDLIPKEILVLEKNVGNIWKTIQNICQVQSIYLEFESYENNVLTFIFRKRNALKEIKLEEFKSEQKKLNQIINRAVCYNKEFTQSEIYVITNKNEVKKKSSALTTELLYPTKTKTFVEDTLENAVAKGQEELYKNRYNEVITLELNSENNYFMRDLDLNYNVKIYVKNNEYKTLPVTQIELNEKNKKSVSLGEEENLWQ